MLWARGRVLDSAMTGVCGPEPPLGWVNFEEIPTCMGYIWGEKVHILGKNFGTFRKNTHYMRKFGFFLKKHGFLSKTYPTINTWPPGYGLKSFKNGKKEFNH